MGRMATHQSKTTIGKFTWRKSILSDVVELAANMREEDKEEALYICSKSKTLVDEAQTSIVTSRICSKIK